MELLVGSLNYDCVTYREGRWGAPFRPDVGDWLNGTIDDRHSVFRIGKRRAGRQLDGKTHNGFPACVEAQS